MPKKKLRVDLDQEFSNKFEIIKKTLEINIASKTDADVIRFMISQIYQQIKNREGIFQKFEIPKDLIKTHE